jgi:hypothetical protein
MLTEPIAISHTKASLAYSTEKSTHLETPLHASHTLGIYTCSRDVCKLYIRIKRDIVKYAPYFGKELVINL